LALPPLLLLPSLLTLPLALLGAVLGREGVGQTSMSNTFLKSK
jgi:hypothetical protein